MRWKSLRHLSLTCMGLFMALAATSQAASEPAARYGFAPTETAAGAAFRMTLSPFGFDCNTEFKTISATVNDTSITLAFVHSQRAVTLDCKAVLMVPPTLVYPVPALKAGKYQVYAMAYPECAYNTDPNGPVCKIAVIPELIGTLAVGITPIPPKLDSAWHIRPVKTLSQKPFDLAVVSNRYGNCQSSFYGQSLSVDADRRVIHVSFGVETHIDRVCIQDVRPHGPTFSAPALKAGKYQVMVSVLPACAIPLEPNGPICMIAIQPVAAAESLTVVDENDPLRRGWFVQPVSVHANADFKLSLLNYAYHPCIFKFTHPSLVIEDKTIKARFAVERTGNEVCTADIRAGGPEFPVRGLAAGDYQVYVSTPAACLFAAAPCDIAEPMPELADTLHVLSASSLMPRSGHARNLGLNHGSGKPRLGSFSGATGMLVPGLDGAAEAKARNVLGRQLPQALTPGNGRSGQ